jgi:ABC-type glycerol-3-phosphate transport system substrate-binding protein
MSEIEFSCMISNGQALELPRFELQTRHSVRYRPLTWANAWTELLAFGINNRGPDISQVGNTWIGSLAGMQALHTFSAHEIDKIGSADNLLPAAWQANQLPGENEIYAIPWIADTRVIFYQRQWLEKAGVDENSAFITHEALVETVERVSAAGAPIPFAFPTNDEVLHTLTPWVWGAGGHFRSTDRRHLSLNEPKTVAGVQQFYRMGTTLHPEARGLRTDQVINLFLHQQAAIAICNHSLAINFALYPTPQQDAQAIGTAIIPGVPFIGGSSLVLWKYSIHEAAAIELIRYLLSTEAQANLYKLTAELPVRVDLLENEPFTTHPLLIPVAQSLKRGRAFQSGYQWANIERRLQGMFSQLWADVFANPNLDVDGEISRRLEETQKRIERTILST